MLGSVSTELVERSAIPVLVIEPAADRPNTGSATGAAELHAR